MLNITSKRFVKTSSSDSEESPKFQNTVKKTQSTSLAYTGATFVPKRTVSRGQMNVQGQVQLVSGRHVSAQDFPKIGSTFKEAQLSYGSDSELSATTEASSEHSYGASQPTKATKNGADLLKCATGTVWASAPNQLPMNQLTQNWGAIPAQGLTQSQLVAFNGCLEKSVTLNGETTEDQNTSKKKTRRGGKKARLRREKQKEKESKDSSDSATESSSSRSDTETKRTQVKYKTELCKNWIETGKCRYSVRCMFAHGYHQLVQPSKPEVAKVNYKSRPCENYHSEFYCNYGTRCIYAHDQRKVSDLTSSYYGKNLMTMTLESVSNGPQASRLAVFEQLTSSQEKIVENVGNTSDETNLPSVCSDLKAPTDECQSFASESTEGAELAFEELNGSIEQTA